MIRPLLCTFLLGCSGPRGAPPTPITPIDTAPVATTTNLEETKAPAIESANALARAFVRCDRPLAKKYVMTYEEAQVLLTKELARDRWETDIEKVVDQGCRELEGKNVVDVRVVETEVVRPSEKEALNRTITLLAVEMTIDEEGQRRGIRFPNPFIETRDGWKMAAQK